jgi:glycine/D-amino acid oxidase-like deaminating enzyme
MDTPNTADIVIIGGGVMGASAAYHLAKCGIKNIVLLEKEEFFGTGATGRCAGGVRYQFSNEINVRLSLESLPMIERFREEIASRVSHWAGLYEVTPGAHPIFGGSQVKGFFICAGFSDHGFMHGPVAGKLLSEYIVHEKFSTLDVSMLDLARFAEGRLIREYNVV